MFIRKSKFNNMQNRINELEEHVKGRDSIINENLRHIQALKKANEELINRINSLVNANHVLSKERDEYKAFMDRKHEQDRIRSKRYYDAHKAVKASSRKSISR